VDRCVVEPRDLDERGTRRPGLRRTRDGGEARIECLRSGGLGRTGDRCVDVRPEPRVNDLG